MNLLTKITLLLIAYGSLFPFEFELNEFEQSVSGMLSAEMPGLGDILGNIALFIPLGVLYKFELDDNHRQYQQAFFRNGVIVFCFALVLQLLQMGLPQRDQNIVDVGFNMLGYFLGWWSVKGIRATRFNISLDIGIVPLCIAGLFIASLLSPFVPSIDIQSLKDSVKPLLLSSPIGSVSDIVIYSIFWLTAFHLIFYSYFKPLLRWFLIIYTAVITAKILIFLNVVYWHDLVSPIVAFTLYRLIGFENKRQTYCMALMLLVVLVWSALSPFAFGEMATELNFLPFHGYLSGQLYLGVGQLLQQVFVFSSLLWLAIEAGKSIKQAAIWLTLLILITEFVQIWVPARTFELGEPVLVIVSYFFVRRFGDFIATQIEREEANPTSVNATHSAEDRGRTHWLHAIKDNQSAAIFLTSLILFYAFSQVVLNLPQVPYNLLELFSSGGSFIDICLFFIALMCLGGSALFVVKKAINNQLGLGGILFNQIAALLAVFFVLYLSVTQESMEDVVGSSTYARELYQSQNQSGIFITLAKVFSLSVTVNIVRIIDFSIRFSSLIGLYCLPLAMFLWVILQKRDSLYQWSKAPISFIALYLVAYHIVFNMAATDNLIELISAPFMMAIAIGTLAAAAAVLIAVRSKYKLLIVTAILIVSPVVSWLFLNIGLQNEVHKYGRTFSAINFLLGPDRDVQLSNNVLFLRWTIVVWGLLAISWLGSYFVNSSLLTLFSADLVNKKIKQIVLYGSGCFLIFYFLFRLFGESEHWQSLHSLWKRQLPSSYMVENSKAKMPDNPVPGQVLLNGKVMSGLSAAFRRAKDFDQIKIGKGYYNEAVVLRASHVEVLAEEGAVIYGKSIQGKGAIVNKGDNNRFVGFECHSIYVPSDNGVCIRHEGKNIVIENVYFHHSQGGFLGSPKGGDIIIRNSRFEFLGSGNFFHGLYSMKNTRLFIYGSYFLNNESGGHEIKSRSKHTEIVNSVVSSAVTRDSRLVDVPNGGHLIIRDSVLVEGAYSENHDLLSWGVEGVLYAEGQIELTKNTIISDKPRAVLLNMKGKPTNSRIFNNVVIGNLVDVVENDNVVFDSRKDISLPDAPFVPGVPTLN